MLNKVKTLLGIAETDNSLDAKLKVIMDLVTARLTTLLGGIEPPESMEHIIIEVTIARYNRIGSEGMLIHTVEGEQVQFVDDFANFASEIKAFLETQKNGTRGRWRFI